MGNVIFTSSSYITRNTSSVKKCIISKLADPFFLFHSVKLLKQIKTKSSCLTINVCRTHFARAFVVLIKRDTKCGSLINLFCKKIF